MSSRKLDVSYNVVFTEISPTHTNSWMEMFPSFDEAREQLNKRSDTKSVVILNHKQYSGVLNVSESNRN